MIVFCFLHQAIRPDHKHYIDQEASIPYFINYKKITDEDLKDFVIYRRVLYSGMAYRPIDDILTV